jgi:hypothetical protein
MLDLPLVLNSLFSLFIFNSIFLFNIIKCCWIFIIFCSTWMCSQNDVYEMIFISKCASVSLLIHYMFS